MRRLFPLTSALALAATGLALTGPGGASASSATTAATSVAVERPVSTPFALKGAGYATRIDGGQLPVSSGTTAYEVIGCTNKAGLTKRNSIAGVDLAGQVSVGAAETHLWTTRKNGVVSSFATSDVAQIRLGNSDMGFLMIDALRTKARAFHDDKGFHATAQTLLGRITFAAPGEEPQEQPLPTPGQPLEIPGFGSVHLGHSLKQVRQDHAAVYANGVRIALATGTKVRVGHGAAYVGGPVTHGVFSGHSNATRVEVVDGTVTSGAQPLTYLPCHGTDGEIVGKDLAGIDLLGQIEVGAASTRQMGLQKRDLAKAFEQATVADVSLAGQLALSGIRGRVNVERRADGRIIKNTDGTTVGEIVLGGTPYGFPLPAEGIELPGLVKVTTNHVEKTKFGIKVVAVRLELLDGTGAVVDLGEAELAVRPIARR